MGCASHGARDILPLKPGHYCASQKDCVQSDDSADCDQSPSEYVAACERAHRRSIRFVFAVTKHDRRMIHCRKHLCHCCQVARSENILAVLVSKFVPEELLKDDWIQEIRASQARRIYKGLRR